MMKPTKVAKLPDAYLPIAPHDRVACVMLITYPGKSPLLVSTISKQTIANTFQTVAERHPGGSAHCLAWWYVDGNDGNSLRQLLHVHAGYGSSLPDKTSGVYLARYETMKVNAKLFDIIGRLRQLVGVSASILRVSEFKPALFAWQSAIKGTNIAVERNAPALMRLDGSPAYVDDSWTRYTLGDKPHMLGSYYTPDVITECLPAILGSGFMDPCSCVSANTGEVYNGIMRRGVRAQWILDAYQDGLKHQWAPQCYINPQRAHCEEWLPEIARRYKEGRVSEMVVLVSHNSANTIKASESGFKYLASAMCDITGRLSFWGPNTGDGKSGSPENHRLVYFGKDVTKFAAAVAALGCIWWRKK